MKHTTKALLYFLATIALMVMFGCDLSQDDNKAVGFTIPTKPDNGWYIRDTANKLSPDSIQSINHRIDDFNKTTRNEIGVLIIPTLNSYNIEDVSHDVFHSWGIGKAGLDNGILIFIVSNDHKMRIETGNGAEGDVPDAIAGQLIEGMKPYLRKDDYAGAITSTIDGITKNMESRVGQKPIVDSTGLVGEKGNLHQTPAPVNLSNSEDFSIDFSIMWTVFGCFVLLVIGIIGAAWLKAIAYADDVNDNYHPPHKAPTKSFKTNSTTNYSDPYYPPPPPRTPHNPAPIVVAAAALTLAERREKQKKEDHARKERDHSRNGGSSSGGGYSSGGSDSGGGYSSGGWDGGSSSGGGFDSGGGGFGGGDSGGGGASGGW